MVNLVALVSPLLYSLSERFRIRHIYSLNSWPYDRPGDGWICLNKKIMKSRMLSACCHRSRSAARSNRTEFTSHSVPSLSERSATLHESLTSRLPKDGLRTPCLCLCRLDVVSLWVGYFSGCHMRCLVLNHTTPPHPPPAPITCCDVRRLHWPCCFWFTVRIPRIVRKMKN